MDRSDDIALFRYGIIRAAADERLSKAERGLLVRALAAQSHTGPGGEPVQVSRQTIDRWVHAYRKGGYGALRPGPRRVEPRTPPDALELACRLRKEAPPGAAPISPKSSGPPRAGRPIPGPWSATSRCSASPGPP